MRVSPGKSYPTAADLDAAFPARPVWLERIDGHAGWANSAAMRAVQRDLSGDWQPDGGRILRSGGEATGIFIDNAVALVEAAVPLPDAATRSEVLRRALASAASVGITGVHDMGTSLEDLALYRHFADAGRLTTRGTSSVVGANNSSDCDWRATAAHRLETTPSSANPATSTTPGRPPRHLRISTRACDEGMDARGGATQGGVADK